MYANGMLQNKRQHAIHVLHVPHATCPNILWVMQQVCECVCQFAYVLASVIACAFVGLGLADAHLLRLLNLSGNPLGCAGVHAVCTSLCKSLDEDCLSQLLELDLSYTQMCKRAASTVSPSPNEEDTGLFALAALVRRHPWLHSLRLSGNDFMGEASLVGALFKAIRGSDIVMLTLGHTHVFCNRSSGESHKQQQYSQGRGLSFYDGNLKRSKKRYTFQKHLLEHFSLRVMSKSELSHVVLSGTFTVLYHAVQVVLCDPALKSPFVRALTDQVVLLALARLSRWYK